MKTLTLIASIIIASASQVRAVWDMPLNPDRFPSFGFTYSGQALSGDRHEIDSPNPILSRDNVGGVTSHAHSVGGDFRFPFSESGTLTLGVDSVTTDSRFTRADAVYHENEKQTGWKYSLGLRVYINH